ncbi:glycosyltransferase family 2 protein [Methylobacterium sp. AMS5]|uniref:glycosyltransferase family 2 protein n=1 Tax=Methylobacterium sp. AMS5 TaxID=925818 RepID=UPI00074F8B03|nr:glycosyltransferase family 2 protein [Methylobacterium sp. AMS5]AMB47376.1 hypothetical protein Y590_20725 [Methylobacterium sp. AMS5]
MKYAAAYVHIKNEDDLILEWMAFHRAVGFEHLIITDNGSSDNSRSVVKRFRDAASVTYLHRRSGDPIDFEIDAIKIFGDQFRWIAFIDADEFLFPSQGGDIRNILCDYEDVSGIGVYWHIYGSSGHQTKPEGTVIETMLHRADDNYIMNRHVKSIVKPSKVFYPFGSHTFKLDGAFVDETKAALHDRPPHGFYDDMTPSHQKLRINHYHVRSLEQYKKKATRGYFGINDDKINKSQERFEEMWRAHDKNDVRDDSALQYLSLMKFYMS